MDGRSRSGSAIDETYQSKTTPNSQTHFFPVSTGLLTAEHVKAIGAAIWAMLWFINRVTKDLPSLEGGYFDGIVLGGQPVPISRISEELGIPYHTCRKHISRL